MVGEEQWRHTEELVTEGGGEGFDGTWHPGEKWNKQAVQCQGSQPLSITKATVQHFCFNVSLFMSPTTLQDELRKLINICLRSLS